MALATLLHVNTGVYINLTTDTLGESNPCLIIRNVCPKSGLKLNLVQLKSILDVN